MGTDRGTKHVYSKVIQHDYGQGWEDVEEYETCSQWSVKEKDKRFMRDLRTYRKMEHPTRVIKRKRLR